MQNGQITIYELFDGMKIFTIPKYQWGRGAWNTMGILPERQGWVVHDGYQSYEQYAHIEHARCNAHHLRELIFIQEQYKQTWAGEMIALLLAIKKAVVAAKAEDQSALSAPQLVNYSHLYNYERPHQSLQDRTPAVVCQNGLSAQRAVKRPAVG